MIELPTIEIFEVCNGRFLGLVISHNKVVYRSPLFNRSKLDYLRQILNDQYNDEMDRLYPIDPSTILGRPSKTGT